MPSTELKKVKGSQTGAEVFLAEVEDKEGGSHEALAVHPEFFSQLSSALKNPPRRKPIRGVHIMDQLSAPRIAGGQRSNNAWPP